MLRRGYIRRLPVADLIFWVPEAACVKTRFHTLGDGTSFFGERDEGLHVRADLGRSVLFQPQPMKASRVESYCCDVLAVVTGSAVRIGESHRTATKFGGGRRAQYGERAVYLGGSAWMSCAHKSDAGTKYDQVLFIAVCCQRGRFTPEQGVVRAVKLKWLQHRPFFSASSRYSREVRLLSLRQRWVR